MKLLKYLYFIYLSPALKHFSFLCFEIELILFRIMYKSLQIIHFLLSDAIQDTDNEHNNSPYRTLKKVFNQTAVHFFINFGNKKVDHET